MRSLFAQLLILQVSVICSKPAANTVTKLLMILSFDYCEGITTSLEGTKVASLWFSQRLLTLPEELQTDTTGSGIEDIASGLEGFSGLSPSQQSYTPLSGEEWKKVSIFATKEINSTESDIGLIDDESNQVHESDDARPGNGGMASGEAVALNEESTLHASGEAMENIQSVESDSSSGLGSEVNDAAESGGKAVDSYTESQVDDPGEHASPPGTNAYEELQDAGRSPIIPFDTMVDSTGYKRDVRLDDPMATPQYARLRPDQAADEGEFAEFQELTDSLSYD